MNLIGQSHSGILAVIIAVTTLITFSKLPGHDFTNWDDPKLVTENPLIRDLSWEGVKNIFTSHLTIHYKPLVFLSWAVEYKIAGLNPRLFHTTNLVLHLFNSLLLFMVLLRLTGDKTISFFTALLFGVHPVHTESVAWVSERKDVLYSFFFLTSLLMWLRYREAGKRILYAASLLLFGFSLLSKMMAVSLPVVLILMDQFKGRKNHWDKVPFFALVFIPLLFLKGFEKAFTYISSPGEDFGMPFSLAERILLSGYEIFFYIWRLLFPFKLSAVYPYPGELTVFHYVLFGGLAAAIAGLVYYRSKIAKITLFGILFFLVTLFPALQIFLPLGDAVTADRYMYMSCAGLFLALFSFAGEKFSLKKAVIPFVAAAAVYAGMAFSHSGVWKNPETLWTDVIRKYPSIKLAWNYRGIFYRVTQRPADAMKDFNRAVELDPMYADALRNRGDVWFDQQRYADAIRDYTQAINADPDFADAWNNRGNAYSMMKQNDQAITDYNKAIELSPSRVEIFTNRGIAKLNKGDMKGAVADYSYAIVINRQYTPAWYNRSYAHFSMRNYKEALADLKEAMRQGYAPDPEYLRFLEGKGR